MYWNIDFRLFCKFSFVFILFTIAGTLHHEFGHFAAGKTIGIDSRISYASTRKVSEGPAEIAFMKYLDSLNLNIDYSSDSIRRKTFRNLYQTNTRYRTLIDKCSTEDHIFRLGGPIITMVTGSIGFIMLLLFRRRIKEGIFNFKYYLLVFISLFWLRQPFNLIHGILNHILNLNAAKKSRGDEFYIAAYFKLNHWSVLAVTGILGFLIATYVVFRVIPPKDRLTFILSGFVGGGLGFYLWLIKFGPLFLP